jgi:hypothetical protein
MTKPMVNGTNHLPTAGRRRRYPAHCALSKPRLDRERISQPSGADDGDDGEQQRPARGQDQAVVDVGDRLETDQRQEQPESEQGSEAGVAQCAGHIDALS